MTDTFCTRRALVKFPYALETPVLLVHLPATPLAPLGQGNDSCLEPSFVMSKLLKSQLNVLAAVALHISTEDDSKLSFHQVLID